ncbi:hypothetical protein TKK_0003991 [Trichogramma kaykai]
MSQDDAKFSPESIPTFDMLSEKNKEAIHELHSKGYLRTNPFDNSNKMVTEDQSINTPDDFFVMSSFVSNAPNITRSFQRVSETYSVKYDCDNERALSTSIQTPSKRPRKDHNKPKA